MIPGKLITGILFLIAVCTTAMQKPQTYPVKRIYGYKQSIIKGVKPQNKGAAVSEKQFVYLLIKQDSKIDVAHVWLNGAEVEFSVQDVKTPVVLDLENPTLNKTRHLTLVPKRDGHVQQVVLAGIKHTTSRAIPNHLKTFELLIAYQHLGKTYYLGSKKMKPLPTEVNP